MIKVHFHLWIGIGTKFTKTIDVEVIPAQKLKVLNHSFDVREHEQDLDAYMDGHQQQGLFCNSVTADINSRMHDSENYEEIREIFRKAGGWQEYTRD